MEGRILTTITEAQVIEDTEGVICKVEGTKDSDRTEEQQEGHTKEEGMPWIKSENKGVKHVKVYAMRPETAQRESITKKKKRRAAKMVIRATTLSYTNPTLLRKKTIGYLLLRRRFQQFLILEPRLVLLASAGWKATSTACQKTSRDK